MQRYRHVLPTRALTVVTTEEALAVLCRLASAGPLLRLIEHDIHVTVKASEKACYAGGSAETSKWPMAGQGPMISAKSSDANAAHPGLSDLKEEEEGLRGVYEKDRAKVANPPYWRMCCVSVNGAGRTDSP